MEEFEDFSVLEIEKVPYLIYMLSIEDDKKTFKIYKEGVLLDNVNSVYISHDDEDCTIELDRQIGF